MCSAPPAGAEAEAEAGLPRQSRAGPRPATAAGGWRWQRRILLGTCTCCSLLLQVADATATCDVRVLGFTSGTVNVGCNAPSTSGAETLPSSDSMLVVRFQKGTQAPQIAVAADFAADIELRTPEGLCLIGSATQCRGKDPCADPSDYCLEVFVGQGPMNIYFTNISDPGDFTVAFEGSLTTDLFLTVTPISEGGEVTLTFTQNGSPYCAAVDVMPRCAVCEQYPDCPPFENATVPPLSLCEEATGETCPTTTVTTTTPESCAAFSCPANLTLVEDAMSVSCMGNPCHEDNDTSVCCEPPTTISTSSTTSTQTSTTTFVAKCESCDWECPIGSRPDILSFSGLACIHTQSCEDFACPAGLGQFLLDKPHERFCRRTLCDLRDTDICCGQSTTTTMVTTTLTTSSSVTTTWSSTSITATTGSSTSTTATTSTSWTSTSSTSTSSTSATGTTISSTLTTTTTRTGTSSTSSSTTTSTHTTASTTISGTSATTLTSTTNTTTSGTGTTTSTSSISTTSNSSTTGTSSSSISTGTTTTTRTTTTVTSRTTTTRTTTTATTWTTTTETTTTRTLTPRGCPEFVNLLAELEDARGSLDTADVMVSGLIYALAGLLALLIIFICFLCWLCCSLRKSKEKKQEEKLDEATKKAERYQTLYTETQTQATEKLDEWSKKFADAHRTTIQAHDSTLKVCESMMVDRKQIGWKGEIVRAWSYYVALSRQKREEELRRQNAELQSRVASLEHRLQATRHRVVAFLERALEERELPPDGAREHFLAWVAMHRDEKIVELQEELYKARASSPASESVIRRILEARDVAMGPGTSPQPPADTWGEGAGAGPRDWSGAPFQLPMATQQYEQFDRGSPGKTTDFLFAHGSPLQSPASRQPHTATDGATPPPGAPFGEPGQAEAPTRGDYRRPLLREGWPGEPAREPSPADQEDWPGRQSSAPLLHGNPALLFMGADAAEDWPAQYHPAPLMEHQDDPKLPFMAADVAVPGADDDADDEEAARPAGAPALAAGQGMWHPSAKPGAAGAADGRSLVRST